MIIAGSKKRRPWFRKSKIGNRAAQTEASSHSGNSVGKSYLKTGVIYRLCTGETHKSLQKNVQKP